MTAFPHRGKAERELPRLSLIHILSDTVQDTLQMLVDADKRIYGDVTGKTLEAIAAQDVYKRQGQDDALRGLARD